MQQTAPERAVDSRCEHHRGLVGPATGSDGEDEFALEVAGVEESVGVGDALERERLLHVDAELALFD